MPSEFEKGISAKFKGLIFGNEVYKYQKCGRLAQGKDPMSFSLYKLICTKMVHDRSKEAIFEDVFLTVTWN